MVAVWLETTSKYLHVDIKIVRNNKIIWVYLYSGDIIDIDQIFLIDEIFFVKL